MNEYTRFPDQLEEQLVHASHSTEFREHSPQQTRHRSSHQEGNARSTKPVRSPKQLRASILELRENVGALRDTLVGKVHEAREPAWGIGRDCATAAAALSDVLTKQEVPDSYRVAVVGRFKAGKSAFVNELLGARLAGEDTSPETAAVTTFCHGDEVKAVIRFVSAEDWQDLRQLYRKDPKHIDAHRIRMWESFEDKPRKNSDGEVVETFDLPVLENEYVRAGGYSIELKLAKPGDRSAENAFRRQLKQFTSGTRPHHCMVTRIEIASPSPLLDEGVELIDTPGLDDTERFRVNLTEKAVEDVDAVLFLTQSGVAYGQSEKDFILTLLRRGTVKQLIFVVTQVDKTYRQHVEAAGDNDEDPESLDQRIRREEQRIRKDIEDTLNELGAADTPTMRRYREQLGFVGLVFTSARVHRDWRDGKLIEHKLDPDDPGGIEGMKAQLLQLLSTESRLALVANNIAYATKAALDDLLQVVGNRLTALRGIGDGEEAERRLATFRRDFEEARSTFVSATESDLVLLRQNLDGSATRNVHLIETIALLAERELSDFEVNDIGRHWKTRRHGGWGYMRDMQARVANRIFPRVQQMLSDMTMLFAAFVDKFEKHLSALSASSADLARKLDLGSTLPFDLTKTLSGSAERSLTAANDLIAAEEQRIVSFLDSFVSEEVSDKISEARGRVADVWGRGTTVRQASEVREFYAEVKQLLQEALSVHIGQRCESFSTFLGDEADGVPRNALAEVQATLASAEQDIRAAAMARIEGQREAFEREAEALSSSLTQVTALCSSFLADGTHQESDRPIKADDAVLEPSAEAPWICDDSSPTWITQVQRAARTNIERYVLKESQTGWPFSRIFTAELIEGCTRVALADPYLAQFHQLRNLKEFLLTVAESAKPREVLVITSPAWSEAEANQERVKEISDDLFRNYGIGLSIKIDPTLHDRCVVFDHGVMFKLGRGLDIYKPATGLASHRPGSRRVRRTEIDVFAVDNCIGQRESEVCRPTTTT